MKRQLAQGAKRFSLSTLNFPITRKFIHRTILFAKERPRYGSLLSNSDIRFLGALANNAHETRSEIFQDIWVLFETKYKRGGFFVEFGATDGVKISNTYLLETQYGWNGILAEPAPIWHAELAKNGSCSISHDCVWSKTGEMLSFKQSLNPGYSTLEGFGQSDLHAHARENSMEIAVNSISLNDLLLRYSAPRTIDFMSVDTEGSEQQILEAFDFDRYDVRLLTVEHNYTDQEAKLDKLLSSRGYERCFAHYSMYDAWYRKISK